MEPDQIPEDITPDDDHPQFIDDDDMLDTPQPTEQPVQPEVFTNKPSTPKSTGTGADTTITESSRDTLEDLDDDPLDIFARLDQDIAEHQEQAERPSEPSQPLDPLEEDIQHFLEITTRREDAPRPEQQSNFVNPAMARVAASRMPRAARHPQEWLLGLRTLVIVMLAAFVVAFIFNYWTPESFLSEEFVANLQNVSSTQGPPTAVPSPLPTFETVQRIGIITGHSGPPLDTNFDVDPGAVCDDNFDNIPELTELEVNTSVTVRLANLLIEEGYEVEMLEEWDDRILNYRGSVLISVHANTCENLGFGATGFNIQINQNSPFLERDTLLQDCLVAQYASKTGLPRHFGTSPDLVDYHVFRESSVDTPTVLVELGFMFADRELLTQRPDDMAQGLFQGMLCFLNFVGNS